MFTRGDWTRRGLGRRILEACEAAAKAEGFRTLALMSTMPGLPLYENYGFTVTDEVQIPMPDVTTIAGASMTKPIDSRDGRHRRDEDRSASGIDGEIANPVSRHGRTWRSS